MFPPLKKMNKFRNSTNEIFAVFACSISLSWDFSRMLIVMSVRPSLTDELLKVNSALKAIFSVIEDQCSGGQWSSKWGRQHFKTSSLKIIIAQMGNKQPSDFWFHQVFSCFRVVWSQFWTSLKFLSARMTTKNNQEVRKKLIHVAKFE